MDVSLKRISELDAVSGNETAVGNYILSVIVGKCDGVSRDALGNIIAKKNGKSSARRVMLATNTDEVGFIVSGITDKGYLKFKAVGAVDPRTIISKRVRIGSGAVKGVIGMKAIHLQKPDERENAVNIKDLYIDIGERKRSGAERRVKLGDYVTFDTAYGETGDILKGKALDRAGIIPLINAMDTTPEYDTYFVFSTQREVLCRYRGRGLRAAAFAVKPDFALVVDTVDSGDVFRQKRPAARLGGGPVIEHMDRTNISNVTFTRLVAELAESERIKTQYKMSSELSTIAGAITAAQVGTAVAVIGIPCRYSHSPVSFVNRKDIADCGALCAAFLRESDVITDAVARETDNV